MESDQLYSEADLDRLQIEMRHDQQFLETSVLKFKVLQVMDLIDLNTPRTWHATCRTGAL